VLPNVDDGPSKDLLMANGWAQREIPPEQLFDLILDPNEANNLAGDPAHADILAGLRGRLETWMVQTEDPLLAGHVDPPSGVDVNEPDQLSATDPTTRVN
jgi:N-sulfoglucosamine sulfohydrolase